MVNLLKETETELKEHSKTFEDIAFIRVADGHIPLERFIKLADIEYDNGYGGAEIDTTLIIMLKDGSWLERWEYDGSEGWEFNDKIIKPFKESIIESLSYNFREE